jgi:hypothetical protein
MMRKPCGLWQITPASLAGKSTPVPIEYTIFPIHDDRTKKGQLLVYAHHALVDGLSTSAAPRFHTAQSWDWIDIGCGIPMAA